jgi:hypothetical protein
MLLIKIGTNKKERGEANDYIRKFLSTGDIKSSSVTLKGEELRSVPQYFDLDIFGEKSAVYLENWNVEDYRDCVYKYLEEIRESQNLFIIDEADMLDASFNKIAKYAYKDTIFDAREDKVKESAFYFADLFLMRKKKEAWIEYLRLLEAGEPAESIAGALIYKLKVSRIDSKIKSELIYKIMSIIALDHDGKLESEKQIEKLILSL